MSYGLSFPRPFPRPSKTLKTRSGRDGTLLFPFDKVRITSTLPWMKTKIPYWMSKKEHELSPLLPALTILILLYYQNDSLKWLGKKLKYMKLYEKNPITMFKIIIIMYSQPLQCSVRRPMACKAPSLSGQFTFQKSHAPCAHQQCFWPLWIYSHKFSCQEYPAFLLSSALSLLSF